MATSLTVFAHSPSMPSANGGHERVESRDTSGRSARVRQGLEDAVQIVVLARAVDGLAVELIGARETQVLAKDALEVLLTHRGDVLQGQLQASRDPLRRRRGDGHRPGGRIDGARFGLRIGSLRRGDGRGRVGSASHPRHIYA